MKNQRVFAVAAAMLVAAQGAMAGVIFSDNFNNENSGNPTLNYYGFANWNVASGSVDLIGNGYFDFLPGNGLYIDTEGSTDQGGVMTTKTSFNFTPGNIYTLSFDLAGDQRGGMEHEQVLVGAGGSLVNQTLGLPSDQGFTPFSYSFTVASDTSSPITFAALENGNVGELLDNVSLTSSAGVPDSASTAGMLAGALLALGLGLAVSRKSGAQTC